MSAGGGRGSRRGPRTLSEEERRLWRGVARLVKPLRGRAVREAEDAEAAPSPPQPAAKQTAKPAVKAARPAKPAALPLTPIAPLARRERQKLARGGTPIDARIDLHGMTQGEAHVALAHFLRRAQRDGARFVLVITGKGAGRNDRAEERGVLRRQVPLWLGLPEFRGFVVGFEAAHMAHGGEGALYVQLRRAREDR
jgi:DNA-nicking Smr family endonuclease